MRPDVRVHKPLIANLMLGRHKGGLEQCLIDYCIAIQSQDFDTYAIIDKRCAYIDQLEKHNIPYETITVRGLWDLWARFTLRRMIKTRQPDAIICHGNRALSFVPARFSTIIYVAHNYLLKRLHKAHHIFAITTSMKERILQKGVDAKHVWFMPNQLNFTRKSYDKSWHTPICIGTMGRMVAKKGFDVFIKALAELRLQGIPFRALLGGDGPLYQELKTLVHQHHLQDHVDMPGWVMNKDAFFDDLDIFCLPSYEEPFGLVMLEAMARKKAIVSTQTDGPTDVLTHNKTALLTPIGDAQALARALTHLMQNPEFGYQLATKVNAHFHKEYTQAAAAHRLNQALKEILSFRNMLRKTQSVGEGI